MNKKRSFAKGLSAIFVIIIISICIAVVLIGRYYPLRYMDIISECAEEFGLEPELICAVIRAESGFNKDAVSSVGAGGLMQVMEGTAYWLAEKADMDGFDYSQIFEPEINIRLGCFYLQMLMKQYEDLDVALCAYNAGTGNVNQWLDNPEYSEDGRILTYIPFMETRNYVERVSDSKKMYAFILQFYALLP